MIRIILITLALLLCLAGCQSVESPSISTTDGETTEYEVFFWEEEHAYRDSYETSAPLEEILEFYNLPESVNPISSKEQALEIGKTLFVRDLWILNALLHTIDENTWTFIYCEEDKRDWEGGAIEITVDGATGRVINAMLGE